jgi:glyoxylase-like metal-dependent hydrolase (beta-lactamase superfamily II)
MMTANQWQIGDVKITRIVEGETVGPMFLLPDATKENILAMPWLQPHFADADGNCKISIHALVVDTPEKTIVVDTCLGNDKERTFDIWAHLQTKFLDDLASAGYPVESVDTVLCTHLHTDHVGWNTRLVDGKWVPTFPNAEYLFGKTEWEYTEAQLENPMYEEFIVDSIQPVIDAGLVRFVDVNETICEGISLVPTPGHTPGHVSVNIESQGERAIITGDFLHHPCQMEEPYWECSADWDTPLAQKTRVEQLAQYAQEGLLVFGTHFASPSAGRVVKKGKHFQFEV